MQGIWFGVVSVMLAFYVVLDGFDFGAGGLHLFVAKTNDERRAVLGAIGPLWDGNEVWLLAAGGTLLMTFPPVLTAGLSGFYLAIFVVLWLLLLRGISIEFRSHVQDGLWRAFWDATFAFSSLLLPVLLGAALGNVVRGVPVDAHGEFNIPLFTHFSTSNPVGILDWYTILMGLFALVTLLGHGALFLIWKTQGPVQDRSRRAARPLWAIVTLLWILTTVGTGWVQPVLFKAFLHSPLAWGLMAVSLAGWAAIGLGFARSRPLQAFLGSSAFIVGLLATTAACLFPVMLRSTLNADWSLTAHNASSAAYGLKAGMGWWIVAFPLVLGYFAFLFWMHRGKVSVPPEGEGY
ncbi:MAG: cytochrome d ubiquinol oxidase subunit II [Firmicutes bacterium]|nr:cytochrome d ubiquinol oxidase subunit II [Bacillota bacterium]